MAPFPVVVLGNTGDSLLGLIPIGLVIFQLGCKADGAAPPAAADSGGSPHAAADTDSVGGQDRADGGRSDQDTRSEAVADRDTATDTGPGAGSIVEGDTESYIEVDTAADDDDLFTISYDISEEIATVGIVTWSVSEPITAARVVFGPAKSGFTLSGDVDIAGDAHQTLLLGMKADTTYKFVIVAEGAEVYTSAVHEITTGPQRTGLPTPEITDEGETGNLFGGFTIGCFDGRIGAEDQSSTVYIFDEDGDFVWWYTFSFDDCSRARMSYDGQRMWAGNSNVTENEGALFSVTMDGEDPRFYDATNVPGIEKRHHDFAVLENGNIIYFARDPLPPGQGATPFGTYVNDEADTVYALDPEERTTTEIYYQNEHFQAEIDEEGSHTNAISFVPHLGAVAFSMKNIHTIAVVSYPDGTLLHTFGGAQSDFSEMSWDTQHEFQVLEDGLVLFNNNGQGGSSTALKYTIDGASATLDWAYSPGMESVAWGSAVALPNGNFLVAFSNNNVIQELSPEGELLQSTRVRDIAYIVRRASLYGPPPPWDR
jgi:hypothetical protein